MRYPLFVSAAYCLFILIIIVPPASAGNQKVEPGIVTIAPVNGQNYQFGDTIQFTGSNTGSHITYLFITGPNLQENGSQIQDPDPASRPVLEGDASTFRAVGVGPDDRWTWTWDTRHSNLDPGTYMIFAVSRPHDKSHLEYTPYGTTTITITRPGSSSARPPDSSNVSFTVSALSVNPAGDLAAGMPVTVSFIVDFPVTGDETFPSSHDLQMATDLGNPRWDSALVLDAVNNPQPESGGRVMFITGWVLSYPPSISESLNVTLKGTAPPASSRTNLTLVNVTEYDEQGNYVGSLSVQAAPGIPPVMPAVAGVTGTGKPSLITGSLNRSAGNPEGDGAIFGNGGYGGRWTDVLARANFMFRSGPSARI
jgi:hypothetical protein